jgi:hypothetical protein
MQQGDAQMASSDSTAPPHAAGYRELAVAMRAMVPMLRHEEARNQLELLAVHYERLAEFVDSKGPLTSAANTET